MKDLKYEVFKKAANFIEWHVTAQLDGNAFLKTHLNLRSSRTLLGFQSDVWFPTLTDVIDTVKGAE